MIKKILHIGIDGIFIRSYIDFIKNEFKFNEHIFLITTDKNQKSEHQNVIIAKRTIISRLRHYALAVIKMHQSNQIVLHGLFDLKLIFILFSMPWLLKKSCWVLWGGDLYVHNLGKKNLKWKFSEFLRRPVIKKINTITTTVPGDYNLAKKWYGAEGKFIQNLMYKSHTCRSIMEKSVKQDNEYICIQIGNSSDPGNNHIEVFSHISKKHAGKFKILCPLAYGSDEHKEHVIENGKRLFGNKFHPITDLMSFEDYNKYMETIDIAIFYHDRQQAMGNIIGLISLGKKVIIKKSNTPYKFFSDLGVSVYTLDDDELLKPIDKIKAQNNMIITRNYFTQERLKDNWKEVFNAK